MVRAVFRSGGKQYHVAEGDVVQLEKLPGEKGDEIEISDILMLTDEGKVTLGKPLVAGASVKARILRQDRSPKVLGFKFKKRKGYTKRWGHRQPFTEIRVEKIDAGA